jgi:phosphoglycerate dehydrogenase-like enzyme
MGAVLLAFEAGPSALSREQLARVQELLPRGTELIVTRDRNQIEAVLDRVEIIAGWFPCSLIPQASRLRWFQQWAAGADWLLDHPQATQMDFVLTSTSGIHAIQMTEHIFALLLALARELDHAVRLQSRRQWIRQNQHDRLFELADRSMLLIGVGAVGAGHASAGPSP